MYQFFYPLIYWWALRLLPVLGYYKLCCYEYWVHRFFWIGVSGLLGYNPSSGVTGSKGSPISHFLRKFHTVLHGGLHRSAFPWQSTFWVDSLLWLDLHLQLTLCFLYISCILLLFFLFSSFTAFLGIKWIMYNILIPLMIFNYISWVIFLVAKVYNIHYNASNSINLILMLNSFMLLLSNITFLHSRSNNTIWCRMFCAVPF